MGLTAGALPWPPKLTAQTHSGAGLAALRPAWVLTAQVVSQKLGWQLGGGRGSCEPYMYSWGGQPQAPAASVTQYLTWVCWSARGEDVHPWQKKQVWKWTIALITAVAVCWLNFVVSTSPKCHVLDLAKAGGDVVWAPLSGLRRLDHCLRSGWWRPSGIMVGSRWLGWQLSQ